MPKRERAPDWGEEATKDELRQMRDVWAMENSRALRAGRPLPETAKDRERTEEKRAQRQADAAKKKIDAKRGEAEAKAKGRMEAEEKIKDAERATEADTSRPFGRRFLFAADKNSITTFYPGACSDTWARGPLIDLSLIDLSLIDLLC